jgi:hypothetical protein
MASGISLPLTLLRITREIIGTLLIAVPENNYFAGFNKIVIIIGVITVALIVGEFFSFFHLSNGS